MCIIRTKKIPFSVKEIGKRAFYGCKSLKRVSIPLNAKIGSEAFKMCNSQILFNGVLH